MMEIKMEIKVGEHQEALLTAFCQVHALGTRRAPNDADGRLNCVHVLVIDGGVEVTAAAGNSPLSAGVAVELEEFILGGQAHEVSQPGDALGEADGELVKKEPYRSSQVLASTKARSSAPEHARPVHVPALPDAEAINSGLAVAVQPISKRARSPGVFRRGAHSGREPEDSRCP